MIPRITFPLLACAMLASGAVAQEGFSLTSPALSNGDDLPADLKCNRDGGDGLSPPLAWSDVPEETQSFAVIMEHYPRGSVAGRDSPSQYWLLWNIPATTTALPRGNPQSIGDEGADKDARTTGYTPPCSPAGSRHEYTITVYALNASIAELPAEDSIEVDWEMITDAIEGKVTASSSLSFWN